MVTQVTRQYLVAMPTYMVTRGRREGSRSPAASSTHLSEDGLKTLCGLTVMGKVNSMTIDCTCRKCHSKMVAPTVEQIAVPSKKIVGFERGRNRGTRICSSCGKKTWQSKGQDQGGGFFLCETCFDEAGLENEHQDGYHAADANGANDACPMCQSEKIEERIEEIKAQTKKDKADQAQMPEYLIEKKFISRQTRKLLFVDLETGEAHYKHQLFDRTYRYKTTRIEAGQIYGYRVRPDGTQYQGPKGDERILISLKMLAKSGRWSDPNAPIPDDGGDDPQESDDGTDRNWTKRS